MKCPIFANIALSSDAEVIKQGLRDYRSESIDLTRLDLGEEYINQQIAEGDPSFAEKAKEEAARNIARKAAAGGTTSAPTPGSSKGKRPAGTSTKLTKPHPSLKGKAAVTSHATSATSTRPHESSKGRKGIGHLFRRSDSLESQRTHDYDDPTIRRDGNNGVMTWIGAEPILYTRLASAEEILRDNMH
jgi:hypothetical protein